VSRVKATLVTEPLAHDLGVDARSERRCRVGVAHVVEPDRRYPGLIDQPVELLVIVSGWIGRPSGQQKSRP
jgi:hypothetical protein